MLKRKAPESGDASSKRRKQDALGGASNEESADVHAVHTELSTLKTKEINDISQHAASLPRMDFKSMKPKPKKHKPVSNTALSTTGSSNATASTTTTLHIPKRIDDSTLVAKHKQVKAHKEQARRSSFGQRGKRVSGSFENGDPVMPHESVPPERFYRHIDADLPEPVRARHLLVWCARRAAVSKGIDEKGAKRKGASKLSSQDQATMASIQDRVLKQLMDLRIDIPLYETGREKKSTEQRLEDDPANIRNREAKERLAMAEERARQEDVLWSKVIQEYNALQSNVLSSLPEEPPQATSRLPDVRLSEMNEKWQKIDEELEFYRLECERGSELDAQLAKRVKTLPVQLDALQKSLARSNTLTEQAHEFIDQLFASIDNQPSSAGFTYSANQKSNLLSQLAKPAQKDVFDGSALLKALANLDAPDQTIEQEGATATNKRLITVVQPSTPRRMPGTPRKGDGGSAMKRP